MQTMKALWLVKRGSWEIRETPIPPPKTGEVRIAVRAFGLNFAELMASQGLYPDAPKLPAIFGYEIAGEIDAVGEGVDTSRIGERVVAFTHFGAHAQRCCVPSQYALPMPGTMSFEAAAALPVTYLTAYHMLFFVANLRPGESVLVHMAAGGVGTAVLQLCQTVDDITTFGTASARKHQILRENGCTYPIDYHAVDYAPKYAGSPTAAASTSCSIPGRSRYTQGIPAAARRRPKSFTALRTCKGAASTHSTSSASSPACRAFRRSG